MRMKKKIFALMHWIDLLSILLKNFTPKQSSSLLKGVIAFLVISTFLGIIYLGHFAAAMLILITVTFLAAVFALFWSLQGFIPIKLNQVVVKARLSLDPIKTYFDQWVLSGLKGTKLGNIDLGSTLTLWRKFQEKNPTPNTFLIFLISLVAVLMVYIKLLHSFNLIGLIEFLRYFATLNFIGLPLLLRRHFSEQYSFEVFVKSDPDFCNTQEGAALILMTRTYTAIKIAGAFGFTSGAGLLSFQVYSMSSELAEAKSKLAETNSKLFMETRRGDDFAISNAIMKDKLDRIEKDAMHEKFERYLKESEFSSRLRDLEKPIKK